MTTVTTATLSPPHKNIFVAGDQDKLKLLVYGASGVGKTRLLATANDDPRTAPILLIDFEGGTQSIVGKDNPVHVWRVTDLKGFQEVLNYLGKGEHPYKSVGLDSFSEVHQQAIMAAMKAEEGRRPENMRDQPQQQDYGKALVQMRRIARGLRDLPLHVLMTALLKEEQDPREGNIKRPYFTGQFAEEVSGIVDVLGWLTTAKGKGETAQRILVTGASSSVSARAKFRVPVGYKAPDTIEEPTIGKILNFKEGKA